MSTHCTTAILHQSQPGADWQQNANIFRHFDGYPANHGQFLFNFLDGMIVGNGRNSQTDGYPKYVNDAGELAGKLATEMWAAGHNPNLIPFDAEWDVDYIYWISIYPDYKIEVCVTEAEEIVFVGSVADFGGWLKELAE